MRRSRDSGRFTVSGYDRATFPSREMAAALAQSLALKAAGEGVWYVKELGVLKAVARVERVGRTVLTTAI